MEPTADTSQDWDDDAFEDAYDRASLFANGDGGKVPCVSAVLSPDAQLALIAALNDMRDEHYKIRGALKLANETNKRRRSLAYYIDEHTPKVTRQELEAELARRGYERRPHVDGDGWMRGNAGVWLPSQANDVDITKAVERMRSNEQGRK